MTTIGVLAVQGAVSEHADALQAAAKHLDLDLDVIAVRHDDDLDRCTGIVLPGGESTTISRLLRSTGIQPRLLERARAGDLAVFGTCAGMILLSSGASHDVADKDIQLLGLLDADVDRNAFGRQRESFEATLDVDGIGSMPAVFIRAPAWERVGDVDVLATFDGRPVAGQKGKVLAAAFHPELTPDTRLHQHFLRLATS